MEHRDRRRMKRRPDRKNTSLSKKMTFTVFPVLLCLVLAVPILVPTDAGAQCRPVISSDNFQGLTSKPLDESTIRVTNLSSSDTVLCGNCHDAKVNDVIEAQAPGRVNTEKIAAKANQDTFKHMTVENTLHAMNQPGSVDAASMSTLCTRVDTGGSNQLKAPTMMASTMMVALASAADSGLETGSAGPGGAIAAGPGALERA